MQPFYVTITDIKTMQKEIPTPDKPVPIEHYIKVFGIWYKEVTNKEELELLEEK